MVLRDYDPGALWTIGTLSSLLPPRHGRQLPSHQRALLSDIQRSALALFMTSLSGLVELDTKDSTCLTRALRDHGPGLGLV